MNKVGRTAKLYGLKQNKSTVNYKHELNKNERITPYYFGPHQSLSIKGFGDIGKK